MIQKITNSFLLFSAFLKTGGNIEIFYWHFSQDAHCHGQVSALFFLFTI